MYIGYLVRATPPTVLCHFVCLFFVVVVVVVVFVVVVFFLTLHVFLSWSEDVHVV